MMKEYLEAGKLVTTHGVRGELKAEVWCDDFEFFRGFEEFYLDSQGRTRVEVAQIRQAVVELAEFIRRYCGD